MVSVVLPCSPGCSPSCTSATAWATCAASWTTGPHSAAAPAGPRPCRSRDEAHDRRFRLPRDHGRAVHIRLPTPGRPALHAHAARVRRALGPDGRERGPPDARDRHRFHAARPVPGPHVRRRREERGARRRRAPTARLDRTLLQRLQPDRPTNLCVGPTYLQYLELWSHPGGPIQTEHGLLPRLAPRPQSRIVRPDWLR